MNIVFGIIIGLIILMLLVIAHEFGHFIMARRNGVKVNEFGIGFPPRLAAWVKHDGKWQKLPKSDWQKPPKDFIFSLNALPIGGFCSMDGESDADTRKGTFGAASFWGKTKILFGGVAMNWLVAFVIMTLLAFVGMPKFMEGQFYLENDTKTQYGPVTILSVLADTPAAKAGLAAGDQILRINGQAVDSPEAVKTFGEQNAGKTVEYTIKREGNEQNVVVQLNPATEKTKLGVEMGAETLMHSTWSAPLVGAATTIQLTGETFRGLGQLVWNLGSGLASQFSFNSEVREDGRSNLGEAGEAVSGPVGIIGVIFPKFVETGPINVLLLTALISVSLACMNILPIPALDGGRWLLILIGKLRGRPIEKATEEKIVSYAFLVLMLLIVVITALDLTRLF